MHDGPAESRRCRWYSRKCPICICDSNTPLKNFCKLRMYHSYISMVRGFLLCNFLISSQCPAASSKGSVRYCRGIRAFMGQRLISKSQDPSREAGLLLGLTQFYVIRNLFATTRCGIPLSKQPQISHLP